MKLRLLSILLLASFGITEFANPMQREATTNVFIVAAGNPAGAIDYRLLRAADAGNIEKVELLLATPGINVNTANDFGQRALHCAAHKGHTAVVHALLLGGAEVNATEAKGWTALHCAAYNGHVRTVEVLLTAEDINADAGDEFGWTALHFAAQNGHIETVKVLVAAKTKIKPNSFGSTPLAIAANQTIRIILEAYMATDPEAADEGA